MCATRSTPPLLKRLRAVLRSAGCPAHAAGAQAYMKSTMPYHGVRTSEFRAICRAQFADLQFTSFESWQSLVEDVWELAQFREERYAAIELTGLKTASGFQDMKALPLYERLIVEGAWWDYVDTIAAHRLDVLLRNEPRAMRRAMLKWSTDADMWKRRASIICQLTFKDDTDLDLLYACIEPSIGSKQFFLRKGIGWALRQVAWHQPEEIVRYVTANKDRLSPLTKREALKNVLKAGGVARIP